MLWVKGRFPKLFWVHFAQTLVSLDGHARNFIFNFNLYFFAAIHSAHLPFALRFGFAFLYLCFIPRRQTKFVYDLVLFGIVVGIVNLGSFLDFVQRWLGDV